MVEFRGVRDGARIIPFAPSDLEELEKVHRGRPVSVAITYARSSRHNRWFHKLLGVIADGIGKHPAVLKIELKHKAGLINDVLISPVFGVHVDYKSVAFAAMEEADFTAFRRAAVDILFVDYLPGVRRRDVYEQVEALTGEPCPW